MPTYGPKIVTDGLRMCLDAGLTKSYVDGESIWRDLTKNRSDATLRSTLSSSFNNTTKMFELNGTSHYASLDYSYGGGNTISEVSCFAVASTTVAVGGATWGSDNWSILDFDRSEVFTFAFNGGGQVQMNGKASNYGGQEEFYDLFGNQSVADGLPHYIGWTYSVSRQEIVMYVDGNVDKVITLNGSATALGGGGLERYGIIGDGSEAEVPNGAKNETYMNGDIGLIHFYDAKALTPNEVKQNYNAIKGRYNL